jgi:hypothetical protein
MATDPAEAIRALRRQVTVAGALGQALSHDSNAEFVKVNLELDDEVDEELDPTPKRMALELTRDDGRSR